MIKTRGVAHFTLAVSDIERSERFYTGVLGMEVISRVPPLNMVFLRTGDDILVIAGCKTPGQPAPGREQVIHHAFRVDADKYDDALAFLRANGVEILHEEHREAGVFPGKQAYFHDPDHNVLEILAQAAPASPA
jgi:glyoxylase I family protein